MGISWPLDYALVYLTYCCTIKGVVLRPQGSVKSADGSTRICTWELLDFAVTFLISRHTMNPVAMSIQISDIPANEHMRTGTRELLTFYVRSMTYC